MTIKRKHRQMDSGHSRWWLVLRGEELEIRTMLHAQAGVFDRRNTYIDLTVPASPVIVSSPIVIANSDVQAPVNSPDLQTPVILPCTSDCSIHSTLSGSAAVTPDDSTESSTLPENN